jgi:hypothetical protein
MRMQPICNVGPQRAASDATHDGHRRARFRRSGRRPNQHEDPFDMTQDHHHHDSDVVVTDSGSGIGAVLGIIVVLLLLAAIWWFALGPGAASTGTDTNSDTNIDVNVPSLTVPEAS